MKTLGFLLCLLFFPVVEPVAAPADGPAPDLGAVVIAASVLGPAPDLGAVVVADLIAGAVPDPGAAPARAHVFYVSVTRVKWNVEEARLDASVRIFTDDLEEASVAEGGPRLRLWTDQAREDRDRHVADYLASRLAFRVNGQERELAWAGMEDALDATSCLVQITNVDRVESIEVENRVLIDMFDTQANVMRFEVGGEKKYVNLSKGTVKGMVRFGP